MRPEYAPLPAHVLPEEGESGPGFLLRTAQRNGMSLTDLLLWVGAKSLKAISPTSLRALAYVADVPYEWLMKNTAARR